MIYVFLSVPVSPSLRSCRARFLSFTHVLNDRVLFFCFFLFLLPVVNALVRGRSMLVRLEAGSSRLEVGPSRVITSYPWPEPETLRLQGVAGPNCELFMFKVRVLQ